MSNDFREMPKDPKTRSLINAQISRRGLLAAAGGVGAVALLASCGSDSEIAAGSFPEDEGGTVRWANWTAYMDQKRVDGERTYPSLNKFIEQTGIDVDYLVKYNDNDEFYAQVQEKLKAGDDIGYDIVTPTDWMAARWIRLGYARELDSANIPNKGNILDTLSDISFDPGRNYSMTWQSGFAGFGWNKDLVDEDILSLDQLFSEKYKGRVMVLSEMRDTIGIILQYQGVDISKQFSEDQFMNAIDFLKQKISDGYIRQVKGNDYLEDMANGDALAVIGWSGDMFSENLGGQNYGFAIPESGGTLWSDNMLIASTSSNKSNSEKLINHYYDPAIAAEVAAWVNYICPVKGAQEEMEKIDPTLAESPFIFPDAETLSKVQVFRGLSAEEEFNYSDAFQEAIGA
ncbi:MAG: spermidine/putrescine ABC transporter substrate-binding protein [Actinobacteria bacterium]|nr:spermidine/putrescine ABC transporter substrate-binding protein [Actinomycetota bacterium]